RRRGCDASARDPAQRSHSDDEAAWLRVGGRIGPLVCRCAGRLADRTATAGAGGSPLDHRSNHIANGSIKLTPVRATCFVFRVANERPWIFAVAARRPSMTG